MDLLFPFSRHDLGRLDRAHLGDPLGARVHFADSTQLLARIAGNTDIVGALQDELDVADFKNLGASLLSIAASRVQNAVHEGVGKVQNRLSDDD